MNFVQMILKKIIAKKLLVVFILTRNAAKLSSGIAVEHVLINYNCDVIFRVRDDFVAAVAGVKRQLIQRSEPNKLLFIGELLNGQSFSPKMVNTRFCTNLAILDNFTERFIICCLSIFYILV